MNFDTLKLGDSFEMIIEDTDESYIVIIMTPTIGYMFFPKVVDVKETLKTVKITVDDKFRKIMKQMRDLCEESGATVTFLPISQTLIEYFQETFDINLLVFIEPLEQLQPVTEPILEEEVANA